MDITNSSESRVNAGIELLRNGHTISFEGVNFHLTLSISTFSDYVHLENVTEAEAKEEIKRSKLVGAKLAEINEAFSEIWNKSKHEYCFGYDYGMGGIEVAQEINNLFKWKK